MTAFDPIVEELMTRFDYTPDQLREMLDASIAEVQEKKRKEEVAVAVNTIMRELDHIATLKSGKKISRLDLENFISELF